MRLPKEASCCKGPLRFPRGNDAACHIEGFRPASSAGRLRRPVGCATSTNSSSTTSFAPTTAGVPMLPETVEEVPSSSPGSTEDGMRSLARDVEMNAQAQPAAYVTQQPASSVAAVEQMTGKSAVQTVSVPAGVTTEVAAAPTQPENENSVVETVVQAPVTVAKATAGVIGAAAQALPNPFASSSKTVETAPPPPEGRLGPTGNVAARSPELDQLMRTYADYYGVPEEWCARSLGAKARSIPRRATAAILA